MRLVPYCFAAVGAVWVAGASLAGHPLATAASAGGPASEPGAIPP